ncbi:type I-F CRISPR-associated endoribonuclease Cas6/Csy4 [Vreelandella piezotolerans]|uniref:Type I-F CRISPR-associated endoribonuclease Cas6/Csy4 n=1 Tax=Vreelandella piezotolerans TaxID=2609667 RepID=A0ABQ6X5G0_9GAMM|nr:type I-F CRISPR-associated endoribonuclease Cas6/Csy4 [Halomonas piezotolerans]KAE8436442.1 type I-F CRISPR-associated endoribonuclease Cas6/Csy4 [Halomonas piezotolerans]QJA24316.1 type I-F CRISPR-associated endoribonuclease Cas6/Csy4 [Halomonas piezotolerans]
MRYFFYIKYLMPSANHAFLAGRCIACLHGFISGSEITSSGIGISFPSWATDTVGGSIAFVSKDFNALSYFSSARYFKNMADEEFIDVSDIKMVPETLEEVRFIRNQHVAKSFPGEIKRRLIRSKIRAEKRGETFMPSSAVSDRFVDHCHVIPIDSHSSGQRFPLYVQLETLGEESKCDSYNSYGLATQHAYPGSVPNLKQIT